MSDARFESIRRDPFQDETGVVSYERTLSADIALLASELSVNHPILPGAAEYAAQTANNGGVHNVMLREQDAHNPTVDLMTVLAGMVLHIRGDFDRVNLFGPDKPSTDDFKTHQTISWIKSLATSKERQITVVCSDINRLSDDEQLTRVKNMYGRLFNTASGTHKIAVLPLWVPEDSSSSVLPTSAVA